MNSVDPDVVVIGGGPAGSTVSTLLAQQGLRVELFERDHFPRFHIGESLIPETYWVLKRLNMLPKMQQSHFVKKYSVQFVNASGKLSAPFYFWDNKPHECSQTWQVVRSEFDQMMLENAREHGVIAHEGVRVLECALGGGTRRRRHDSAGRRSTARSACQRRRRRQRAGGLDSEQAPTARLGSHLEQGRDLDLLGGRVSRHRARRRRHDGAADRARRTAGSGTSRSTTTSSASASWRRSITCSRIGTHPATTSGPTVRKWTRARR